MPNTRMSRIQALRRLLSQVDDLDKKVRTAVCLSVVAVIVSMISTIFQISFCLSYM